MAHQGGRALSRAELHLVTDPGSWTATVGGMSEFSVIIPTLQRAKELHELVEMCAAHPRVLELLVINNAPEPLAWDSPKVRVLQQAENIYVNPAWNLGAREAQGKYLAVLNDDILFDPSLFDHVHRWLTLPGIGIVGGGHHAGGELRRGVPPYILPAYHRPDGFGIAMFMHRSRYEPIPESMRIWYGDDWLFYRQTRRNFTLYNAGIQTEMSVTSDAFAQTPLARADADAARAHDVYGGPYKTRFGCEGRLQTRVRSRLRSLRDRRR